MVRHLGDPDVGAVTAYIKEGSRPANYLNRFVAFEYVNAQAGARRAQNVLGAQACLAGGAQLLRRESLDAIGGAIDTSSLAEDTFTTFNVQLAGKRVVFEPHAIVWAEEPRDIAGLWKQRLRWGRGNVQVTRRYRDLWLHRGKGRLGGVSFALIWFSVLLMPVLMVVSSFALVVLFLLDRGVSVDVFRALWLVNLVTYLFITLSTFALDPPTARRTLAPGLHLPRPDQPADHRLRRLPAVGRRPRGRRRARPRDRPRRGPGHRAAAVHLRLAVGGHARGLARQARRGHPAAAAGAAAALRRRLRAAPVRDHRHRLPEGGARHRDDVGEDGEDRPAGGLRVSELDDDRRADLRFERRLFWLELVIVAIIAALIVLRGVLW